MVAPGKPALGGRCSEQFVTLGGTVCTRSALTGVGIGIEPRVVDWSRLDGNHDGRPAGLIDSLTSMTRGASSLPAGGEGGGFSRCRRGKVVSHHGRAGPRQRSECPRGRRACCAQVRGPAGHVVHAAQRDEVRLHRQAWEVARRTTSRIRLAHEPARWRTLSPGFLGSARCHSRATGCAKHQSDGVGALPEPLVWTSTKRNIGSTRHTRLSGEAPLLPATLQLAPPIRGAVGS